MKRIIVLLALMFTIGTAGFAQTATQQPPQKMEHIKNPKKKKHHGDKSSKEKGKYDKHKHKHKHRHMHHKKKQEP